MRKLFAKVFEVYRPFRRAMLGVFGFIVFSQALNLVAPYLQGKVIDDLVSHRSLGEIYLLVGATLVVSLVRMVVVMYAREVYELRHVDFKIPRHISSFSLGRLFGFSIGQHVSENSGVKQNVLTRGQHSLASLAKILLYQALPMCVEVVLLIGILLYESAILGVIVLFGAAGYVAFVIAMNGRFRDGFKKMEELWIEDSKFHGEVLQNVELVLTNAQEAKALRECDESLGKSQDFAAAFYMRFARFLVVRNTILAMTRCAVLAAGTFLTFRGDYSVGSLVMFLSWSGNVFNEVASVGNLHRQLVELITSVMRYFEMLAIEPDVKVLPNPVRPEKFAGRIEFKNVTFRYKRREVKDEEDAKLEVKRKEAGPALRNVSFVIEAGETVAFVGESGAGKSTLVHALVRAQDPEEGQIILDGNDLRVLDLAHFRKSIGIVDQEVSLFDHTLRYNLTFGLNGHAVEVTEKELDRVAEMACVNRFFPRLEKGYDTVIGERGVKLSGGERQRVGIARALVKDPDILIFDEATSNLDSENEELIRQSIEQAAKGRTTIVIAHRFSTIRAVDKVIVLDKGSVVGVGVHDKLAETCVHYQRLLRNQIGVL